MVRGEVVGQIYQIVEEIGKGGTGVIYKAYHLRLEKYVVIKKIKDNFCVPVSTRWEADILKELHHTCLPQVYDFIQQGSQVFTVMEYIDGYDFEYYLSQGIYFEPPQLLAWLRELCGVLAYLHAQTPPILHSDIKPANIMVTKEGQVYLIDFNISFGMEEEQDILGFSPYYAAPEQVYRAYHDTAAGKAPGTALDGRMDLYSLAATFYTLISGVRPSTDYGANLPLLNMQLPQFPPAFLAVVDKAMQADPDHRYQTAKQMYAALQDLRKLDRRYRRLRVGQVAATTGYAVMLVLCAGLISHGLRLQTQEGFQKGYEAFYDAVKQGNGEQALDQGLALLNRESYQGILKKQTEEKAAIFYAIGSYYYGLGDYGNASGYYEQAAKTAQGMAKAGYCRDYAIALAKEGLTDKAQDMLSQSQAFGLSSADASFIRAEIAYETQDYEKAKEEANAVLAGKADTELSIKAYLLKADIAKESADFEGQISCLEKAKGLGGSKEALQKLGAAYVEAARQAQGGTVRRQYYQEAQMVYKSLASMAYPSVEDRLNLALVCLQLGESYHCERLLLSLADENDSDYRVWMYLAFAYEQDGDLARMKPCCEKAVKCYEALGAASGQDMDGQIAHLYEIYERSGG